MAFDRVQDAQRSVQLPKARSVARDFHGARRRCVSTGYLLTRLRVRQKDELGSQCLRRSGRSRAGAGGPKKPRSQSGDYGELTASPPNRARVLSGISGCFTLPHHIYVTWWWTKPGAHQALTWLTMRVTSCIFLKSDALMSIYEPFLIPLFKWYTKSIWKWERAVCFDAAESSDTFQVFAAVIYTKSILP